VLIDPEPPANHTLTYVLIAVGAVVIAAVVALEVIFAVRKRKRPTK
jgi:hypothetical protein